MIHEVFYDRSVVFIIGVYKVFVFALNAVILCVFMIIYRLIRRPIRLSLRILNIHILLRLISKIQRLLKARLINMINSMIHQQVQVPPVAINIFLRLLIRKVSVFIIVKHPA